MAKIQILVVEDDNIVVLELRDRLRSLGYAVCGVASYGEEAIEKAAEMRPDLVLMDIRLKGAMNGVRAAEEIRARFNIPVVYLTAYADEDTLQRAKVTEPYGYIIKPFQERELHSTIEVALYKHKAEEALQESEEKLRNIVEHSADGIVLTDEQGAFIEWNRGQERITGLTRTETLGRPIWDVMFQVIPEEQRTPAMYEQLKAQLLEFFRTGQVPWLNQLEESTIQRPDGTRRTVQQSVFPIKTDKGFMAGGILRDITDRKRAEESLRQRTAQLEAARQVGLELTAQLDLDALLHSIVSRAIELIGGTAGGLHLYRPDRDVLEWSVSVGPDAAPIGTVLHRGEGLSGRVWETGTPLIVDNYQTWEGRAAVYEDYPFRTVVGVPVRWGDEFLGVLEVLAAPPRTFSPTDAELLSLFATQAAVAIRNARLYEETRRRALEQETVSRIAYALNTPDVRDAFPVLVEGLRDLTGCDLVNLVVMDEAGEQCIMSVLESPFPTPEVGDVMPLSATAAAEDVKAGRPHLTADLSTETHLPFERALYQAGLRSQVTLPLLVGGEVFGALNLGGSDMGLFREDQLPVLRQIADAVALALENSLLFRAEREQRELAESLEEAAAVVSSTLDPDQVLDRILEQVSRVVPNDATNIMLIEGDQAHVVRWRGYERFGAEEIISTVVFCIAEVPGFQQMLESGEPMVIPDTTTYPGWVRVPAMEWLRSYAAAPIIVRGEVIGFLNVDSTTPGFFTQTHAEGLRVFADHAAAAIENARLYEAEQKRRHIAETLRQASTVLSSILELDEVLGLILQQLRQVIPYDSASVQQLENERLEIVACQGFEKPDKVVGLVFPLDPDFPNYHVVMTRAPLAVEDVTGDYPHFKDEANTYESGRIRSWLGVPLMVKDQVIGMITLDRVEVRPYTAEEAQLAMAFANQAAIAIENARLFEEERRRSTQLVLINDVGDRAASILDLDKLMQEVTRYIQEKFNYYNVALLLLDEERSEVVMQAVAGGFEHIAPGEYRQSLDEGIVGFVTRTGNSWLANDVSKDPHYVKGFLGEVLTKSELCVTIKLGDKVIGALDVQSIRLNDFDQADVVAMDAVADQVAIAIENARLYDEAKKRAEEMAALHRIGLVTTSTLDLDEVLKLIYEQVSQLMKPDTFYIALYNGQMEEINFEIYVEKGQHLGKFSRTLEEAGLTAWIIQSNQPLLIKNTAKESFPTEPVVMGELTPEMSYLGVPLTARGKVVGVISVQSFQPYVFDEGDQRFLSAIASQAAIAIENARLFGETERLKAFNESVVQGVAEAILIEDAHGILTFANPAVEELLGYTHEELIGRYWTTIVPEDERERVRQELTKRPQGIVSRYETALLDKKGQRIPVIVSARPLFKENKFAGVLSAFTDIRARVQAEREIEERRMYLEGVLGAAPDAIVTTDARHRVVEWNAGAERLFGYSREEVIGRNLDHVITNPDVFEEASGFTQVVMSGREVPPIETVRYRKDGSHVHVIVAGSPILVGDELIGVVAVYTDITQRKRMEDALRASLLVDELTGLYNRRGFSTLGQQQLKMADRAKSKMSLLFADFDELKWINDTLGHPEGDLALIEIANVLKETFRESDIIARIGGDEFVVLVIETDGASAGNLTSRLQQSLEARNARGDHRYKLSLSMGIARYDPENPCSIDELLARADKLMYEQKQDNLEP